MPFLGPKWSICPEQFFFGRNHYYYHLPIDTFHCAKFLKNLTADPRVPWGCIIFWVQNGRFAPPKIWKIINIILIYLAPFVVPNFKKNSSCGSRVMRMCIFGAQNSPFAQIRIFSENLLMSFVSLFHAYLNAKNQMQILIY